MIYDVVIVGGGISGLYTAYRLLSNRPMLRVLLLEKSGQLGGRVWTFSDKHMTVDGGAGRFSEGHARVVALIRDLGLSEKVGLSSASAVYMPANNTNLVHDVTVHRSVFDAPRITSGMPLIRIGEPLFLAGVDIALANTSHGTATTFSSAALIAKVILASKLESRAFLMSCTFLEYARTILSEKEVQYIEDSFGYYSELVLMNAYDCIALMGELGPGNTFYVLNGGLSQIIRGLERALVKFPGFRVMLEREVSAIKRVRTRAGGGQGLGQGSGHSFGHSFGHSLEIHCTGRKTVYVARACVCAMPVEALKKLAILRPVRPLLDKILCAPLCRIYCRFSTNVVGIFGSGNGNNKSAGVWFAGLPKITTNNALRMIIPISEDDGIIMISYSDNKFADFWKGLYDRSGKGAVEEELRRLIFETCGRLMPVPLETHVFYWGCGVGYWGVGANSTDVAGDLVQPLGQDNALFLCGENISAGHQQWMEGALETGERVVDRILSLFS